MARTRSEKRKALPPALSDIHVRNLIKECTKGGTAAAVAVGGGAPGLTLTVSKAGLAAFIIRYKIKGRAREYTAGRYPDLSLADARDKASELRKQIAAGVDIAAEKRRERLGASAIRSVRELAANYTEMVLSGLRSSTVETRRYHLDKLILPAIGATAVDGVRSEDIVAILKRVKERRTINTAKACMVTLKTLFDHAVGQCVITANPCHGLKLVAIVGKAEDPKQRIQLSAAELGFVFAALNELEPRNALAVRILLFTGVRLSELTMAEWQHVDLDRGEWTVTVADGKKSKREIVIPLAPVVVGYFAELKTLAAGSPLVVPSFQERRQGKPIGANTLYEQIKRALKKNLPASVRDFSPHDLRSTAKSALQVLGVERFISERCLNHKITGVEGIYDKNDYLTERRIALCKLADYFAKIETGEQTSNVIRMATAA